MRPSMKSASPRPDDCPLKVNCPLLGRLLTVSMRVWIQLPPNDTWCFPSSQSRSLAIWKPFELKYPGLVPPVPKVKPLVTDTPMYPGMAPTTVDPTSVGEKNFGIGRSLSVLFQVTCSALTSRGDRIQLC